MSLTIAKLRRAADELRAENTDVRFTDLASKLGCKPDEVEPLRSFIAGRVGLRNELGLLADPLFPGLVFMCAVDKIRQAGDFVTTATLMKEMKKTRQGVAMALVRHPEWLKLVNVLSEFEARRRIRVREYKSLAQKLRSKKQEVTKAALARACNVERYVVTRDFNKVPELCTLLTNDKSRS